MSPAIDNISQQKLDKLAALRTAGIDPYPYGFHRSNTAQQAIELVQQNKEGLQTKEIRVEVAGRIMSKRGMGKSAFMDLKDGSGKIQLLFRINVLGEIKYALAKELDVGDIVGVGGRLFLTHTGEPTIEVDDFTLLAKAIQPLPEKWHGLVDVEKRYRQRYLDIISNAGVKHTFEVRSKVITTLREFLNKRGFLEVETPILQPEAGGAAARPFITHHNTLDRDFYLRIALELHLKRLIIGGFDKVYEIGRVFRNEGIDFKHTPEYTLLETYEAYADYQDVMKMVEEMVSKVCEQVLGTTKVEYNGHIIDFNPPWRRLEMRQAIIQYTGLDFEHFADAESLKEEMTRRGMQFDPVKGRGKLIDELVSTYVDPELVQPTFLYDYPVELSPLAKKKPGNERLVERFEPYAGGMEIGNAFTELNDPIDQKQRFIQQMEERAKGDEEAQKMDEDFLLAMEYGMPPTGGLGIGVDRLVMLLTNQTSIREVIFFPALRTKEE
jgi:lysyl-tRNA synthetase class 2